MFGDLRFAIRQHARRPGFAVAVVSTLAVTIGATLAVFTVVNTVLVRALPFSAPERLVWIASVRSDNLSAPFSLPEFMDYRTRTRTLSGLAAYANWSASIAGDSVTERVTGLRLSANAFDILGVTPAAGRLLRDEDDRADAPLVVVLSHRLWRRKYGGSADVVGQAARINGEPHVIVGVLPPEFPIPLQDVDIVTPLAPERDPLRHARSSVNFLRLFGRLAPGTPADRAQVELTAICRALRQQFPAEYARKEAVRVDGLHEVLVSGFRQSMLLLLAAVVVVLATALANLLSLALVRASGRRAELSMRIAIGASRLHLVRQLTVEALLLAVTGGVLGWVVAAEAIRFAMPFAPPSIPRLSEAGLDGSALWFAVAATAAVTTLLTIAPLTAASGARTAGALRAASRGAVGDRWNRRVGKAMVAAEIAAALVLILATIELVQNLRQLERLHPGFNPDGVFQARVSIPPTYRSPDDLARFYERMSERIAASPGVKHVGVISVAPLSGLLRTVPFAIAGQASAERDRLMANLRVISPGYLAAVNTRLLRGRHFAEMDTAATPPVAIVSAPLADQFLPGEAIGQRLMIFDNSKGLRPVEIVGVVEPVHHTALDLPPALDIYVPLRQAHPDGLRFLRDNQFWLVRTDSDPAAFRATFLAHLGAVDADAAVSGAGTMRRFVDESLGPRRFNLGLFGAFASTTVLLAVVGLYGLVSYTVSQRTQEIGLRMAIGASQRDVLRMILREAVTLGVAGVLVGLGAAVAARRFAAAVVPSLPAAGAADGIVAMIAALSMVAVVLLAAWVPARRASRMDPTTALLIVRSRSARWR